MIPSSTGQQRLELPGERTSLGLLARSVAQEKVAGPLDLGDHAGTTIAEDDDPLREARMSPGVIEGGGATSGRMPTKARVRK